MTLSRTIAETVVRGRLSASQVADVLAPYNLLGLLPSILKETEKLLKKDADRETVHIESPFALDEQAVARIRRIVGNDLAETEVTINKELLAGFKARYKGKLYDGSAERIIRQLTN